MAIEVLGIEPGDEAWRVDLRVFEGVYHKERYAVRIVDVPRAPEAWSLERQKDVVASKVCHEVTQHMRRGSLPPTGMQMDGESLWQIGD